MSPKTFQLKQKSLTSSSLRVEVCNYLVNSLYLRLLKLDATSHHDCWLSRNVLVIIECEIFSDTLTLTVVSSFSEPGIYNYFFEWSFTMQRHNAYFSYHNAGGETENPRRTFGEK